MKASELRELDRAALEQKGRDLEVRHFELRLKVASGGTKVQNEIVKVKRDIARIKTILTEMEGRGQTGSPEASKG
ncbi:MAG: 50S ribosomal protein L29 [Deltaproteobacteria bacterium]|nr:50S ribosomal protein L29 [Deltaproteobacteria bacterium]